MAQQILSGNHSIALMRYTSSSRATAFLDALDDMFTELYAGGGAGITLTDLSALSPLSYNNTTGVFSIESGYQIGTTTQVSNWDTAYGWGNHADAGYYTYSGGFLDKLAYFGVQEPYVFGNILGRFRIESSNVILDFIDETSSPTTYSMVAGYLDGSRFYVSLGPSGECLADSNGGIRWRDGNSTNANTAYSWGNHASAGYLTSVTAHNLLSATHGDTTTGTVVRGDIITGQGATPKWTKLAIGSVGKALVSDGTDVVWSTSALGTAAYTDSTSYATSSHTHSRVCEIIAVADTTTNTTGDAKATFTIPYELNGYNLTNAAASVSTVSSSGTVTVQIRNVTDSQDMLSTLITIDANENTSYTAATSMVIDTSHDDVATGDEIAIDLDGVGTGSKGLKVILTFSAV